MLADRVKNPTVAEIQTVMESFAPGRLPSIEALANAFCVCDNWFSEVPGPTQPNRLYMQAASSFGYVMNDWSQIFSARTIYNNLQDAGHTWAVYFSDVNEAAEFSQVNTQKANFKDYTQSFAADVSSGALPNYAYIVPRFYNTTAAPADSQHPPHDARYGDNLIADVYGALRSNSALWQQTAFIVIYDEHGGFYDHVIPPTANVPNPDGINSPPPGTTASSRPLSRSTVSACGCRRSSPRPGFRPARLIRPSISTRRCWRRSRRSSVFPVFSPSATRRPTALTLFFPN